MRKRSYLLSQGKKELRKGCNQDRIPGSDPEDRDPAVPLNLVRRGLLKFSMSPEVRWQEDKEADGGQVG